MKTLAEILHILALEKEELRARFGVKNIGIFGSWVRGEQVTTSDLDILVEFEHPIGWEIVDLHEYLEEILGVKVDLVSANAVKRKPKLWHAIQQELTYA